MSLWRKARAELTGAVRSMQYDMGRRPVEPPSGGPDMTSTGMNTFGVQFVEDPSVTPTPAHARRPRRTAAVTVLGVLTVVGAAGVYLGVVNGLGSLLDGMPASADTLNPHPAVTMTFTPNSGLGRGPVAAAPMTTPAAPAPGTAAPGTAAAGTAGGVSAARGAGTAGAGAANPANPPASARNTSPIRTTKPAKGECGCDSPPVPTPTAPAPSSSPSPTGDPTGTADPSEPASPDPSETSATPSDSAEPSYSWQDRHHRRHH
jgi:hypothetical protein